MLTLVCEGPGDLRLAECPCPERKTDEALIRIRRVGICGTDMHIYAGNQPFLSYPRIMGHELAGEVVQAPAGSGLEPGDQVFIIPYLSCGSCIACRKGKPNCCTSMSVLGVHRDGGLAQYIAVPASCVRKAAGISLDQAAMVEFLAIGAHAVRRSAASSGDKVLVVGGGPIGIAVAIFARIRGATVCVLDRREDRLAFCTDKIGVNAISLSPSSEAELTEFTKGDFFDIVFDATGNAEAMQRGFGYVAHGGTYVLVSIVPGDIRFSDPEFHKRELTLLGSRNATAEDFETVIEAMRNGLIPTDELKTHTATLENLPQLLPEWSKPSARVIKALVNC